ncbi:unnamed protein product [marine sediment metagenome]|uniref:Uncharacterized protein n=1 Tax=marine sediment metagenome TaxID=412755 RepID=X0SS17_9ZZZZ
MPKAEDRRKDCRYCHLKRGMKQGTDMCFQCFHLWEIVRDNLPTLMRLIPVKFPDYLLAKKAEFEPEREEPKEKFEPTEKLDPTTLHSKNLPDLVKDADEKLRDAIKRTSENTTEGLEDVANEEETDSLLDGMIEEKGEKDGD